MSNAPLDRSLPGNELVEQGLADLSQHRRDELRESPTSRFSEAELPVLSDYALLVLIAAPRLRRLGIHVPIRPFPRPLEHLLYDQLELRLGAGAHSHYNSLIRRIVSFAHALERERSRHPHA